MYINNQGTLLDLGVPILAPGWRRDHQVRKGVVRKRCVHKQNTHTRTPWASSSVEPLPPFQAAQQRVWPVLCQAE